MEHVYVAGKLFKRQDVDERIKEGKKLAELKYDYFNPTEQPFNLNREDGPPTAEAIFMGDTKAVLKSDIILAELDDEDSGTMAELGISWAISHLHDYFESGKTIEDFKNEYPRKMLCAHATDIRTATAGRYNGYLIPKGWNQYIVGMIEDKGKIYTSKDEMWDDLKKRAESYGE